MSYSDEDKLPFIKRMLAGESAYKISQEPKAPSKDILKKWLATHEAKGLLDEPKNYEGLLHHSKSDCGIDIAVIGDVQAKKGVDFTYLRYVGQYIAHKRPDVIVCIGDFADMPSGSTHDAPGSKASEGQRYMDDIIAAREAMKTLMKPIQVEMKKGWKPRLVFTSGNHEDRIRRMVASIPKLEGVLDIKNLGYEDWGWEVYPFLEPVIIEGVAFCHYFCSGVMGNPITSARALLNKKHMSCIAGHQQGRDIAYGLRADGKEMTAIISGSCYEHQESYLNHQTNNHFRGFYFLHDVVDGSFDEMAVSLKYLRRRYGND